MKKSFHVDVIITDGSKRGVVLTVKRTSRNKWILFDRFDCEGGLPQHLTCPKNGRIHVTYSHKGSEPCHEFWARYDAPLVVATEFRVSDPSTWGSESRRKLDETVCFDIRSHIGDKRDVLTVAATLLEPGKLELSDVFSDHFDVLLLRVIKDIDDCWLAIAIYATKDP